MSLRSHLLVYTVVLALVLAFGATLAVASTPYYAVAVSLGKVFLIKYDGTTVTSSLLSDLNQSSLTGVATWNGHDNKVFVADSASTGDTAPRTLRVGRLVNITTANPGVQWLGDPIQLKTTTDMLKQPGAMQVDASGGIYVVGSKWSDGTSGVHSGYAYVTPTNSWNDAAGSVSIARLETSTLFGVALPQSGGAVFSLQDTSTLWDGQSCVRSATGVPAPANPVKDTKDGGYFPQGITTGHDLTYMANYSTETDPNDGPTEVGSISVLDSSLNKISAAFQLGSFRPTDLSFFTVGTTDYLGVVGVLTNGHSQAWRLKINPVDGTPTTDGVLKHDLDSSSTHYCTVSSDDSVFWATNPQAGTVAVFDTSTWACHVLPSLGVGVGRIAQFLPDVITIPKPWLSDMPTQLYWVGRPFVGPTPQFVEGKAGSTFDWVDPADPADHPAGMVINHDTGVVTWPNPVRSNKAYTITVMATNGGGSGTASFTLSQFPKHAQDGEEVATARVAVTAVFAGEFYIESLDRLWGMLVMQAGSGLSVGQLVDVHGTMHTNNDGVRFIDQTSMNHLQGYVNLDPIFMPMNSVCGGKFPGPFGFSSGQWGITGGHGLNNVGLYVKVCGAVISVDEDFLSLVVDDNPGVETRVLLTTPVTTLKQGDLVEVTGICSMQKIGDAYVRSIKARDQYGLVVIPKE